MFILHKKTSIKMLTIKKLSGSLSEPDRHKLKLVPKRTICSADRRSNDVDIQIVRDL